MTWSMQLWSGQYTSMAAWLGFGARKKFLCAICTFDLLVLVQYWHTHAVLTTTGILTLYCTVYGTRTSIFSIVFRLVPSRVCIPPILIASILAHFPMFLMISYFSFSFELNDYARYQLTEGVVC